MIKAIIKKLRRVRVKAGCRKRVKAWREKHHLIGKRWLTKDECLDDVVKELEKL